MINFNTPKQKHTHMSHALSLEAKRSVVPKKPLSHSIQVGANSLLVLVAMLCALITFLYLAHANRSATQGYSLKTLNEEIGQLQTEIEVAEMQISQLMALETIQKDEIIVAMAPAGDRLAFVGPESTYALAE